MSNITPTSNSGAISHWRRLGILSFMVVAILLALFFLFSALGLEKMLSPQSWATKAGIPAALVSCAVLSLDVLLPVPSSLVMVANGTLFGLWGGAALSIAGSLVSSLVAYALGRGLLRGAAARRMAAHADAARFEEILMRWGISAIVLSRPLPLLAETVAIIAGAAGFNMPRFVTGSLLGAVPIALVYAAIGASAVKGAPLFPLLGLYLSVVIILVLLGRREVRPPACKEGD